MTVQLASQAMPPADDFIRHKTTRRAVYAAFAPKDGAFDTLLFNQAGELTEFTIGNLALKLAGEYGAHAPATLIGGFHVMACTLDQPLTADAPRENYQAADAPHENLVNTTIETYFQDPPSSCMSCHQSVSNALGRDFVGMLGSFR